MAIETFSGADFLGLWHALDDLQDGDTLVIENDVSDWTGFTCSGDDWCYQVTYNGNQLNVWNPVFQNPDKTITVRSSQEGTSVSIGTKASPITGPLLNSIRNATFLDIDMHVNFTYDTSSIGFQSCSESFGAFLMCTDSSGDGSVTMERCRVYGSITLIGDYVYNLGGLVGSVYGSARFTDCVNYADIYYDYVSVGVGGIVGDITAIYGIVVFERCANEGNITLNPNEIVDYISDDSQSTGGIVGTIELSEESRTTVSYCLNTGKLTGVVAVGGIIGKCTYDEGKISIANCENQGVIWGEFAVSGILGITRGQEKKAPLIEYRNVSHCTNNGTISGATHVGGIVGDALWVYMYKCVNNKMVTAHSPQWIEPYIAEYEYANFNENWLGVGGIAGYSYGSDIVECHNIGPVLGLEDRYATGGIAGLAYSINAVGVSDVKTYDYIYRCVNDGPVRVGSWLGGIAGAVFANFNVSGWGFAIEECVNRASVVASNGSGDSAYAAGGIVGYALGAVTITRNRLCRSAGVVAVYGSYAGGIVGMVDVNEDTINDAELEDVFGVGGEHRVVISYNMANAAEVIAAPADRNASPSQGVRRILGMYLNEENGYDEEQFSVQLLRNIAGPDMRLTGDNTGTPGFESLGTNPTWPGIAYMDSPVELGDPDLGLNRMNGWNASCSDGILNDCMYCVETGRCPDGESETCAPDVTGEIALVLDGVARMRAADSRYLWAQRTRERLIGDGNAAAYGPTCGPTCAPSDPLDIITSTESTLARAQCCSVDFLKCCCISGPDSCLLCAEFVDPLMGEPIVNAECTLTNSVGKVQTATTDSNGMAQFSIASPGEYRLVMPPSTDGSLRDNAVYIANVDDCCNIQISVNPNGSNGG
ncbi:MAG: carboxypeptidase-like regulatory domain-containing protein [Oscillospiraceae bacterium]|jgi:hypothetical protein|nr:carboxypeptidase-like regulatory domain-containing protein [Oscillospiraceae bacterium]